MSDAKELLWLDHTGDVMTAQIQTSVVVPGAASIPDSWEQAPFRLVALDQLVVEYRPQQYFQWLPLAVWVLTDEGAVMPYSAVQWQYFPSMAYPQLTLVPHDHLVPVPTAIMRYVNGAFSQ